MLGRHWLLVIILGLSSTSLYGGKIKASLGVNYSSGDYSNSDSTDIWSMSGALRYKTGRWKFKGSLPYLKMTGPGNVIGTEGVVDPGAAGTRRSVKGIGDLQLSVGYNAYYNPDKGINLAIKSKLKVPTASKSKGLGTGEPDLSVQLEPMLIRDTYILFTTLGYKLYGDTDTTNYRNVLYGSLGAMTQSGKENDYGIVVNYRQAVTATSDARRSLMLFSTHKLDKTLKLQAYLTKGAGTSSPDMGAGIMLIIGL